MQGLESYFAVSPPLRHCSAPGPFFLLWRPFNFRQQFFSPVAGGHYLSFFTFLLRTLSSSSFPFFSDHSFYHNNGGVMRRVPKRRVITTRLCNMVDLTGRLFGVYRLSPGMWGSSRMNRIYYELSWEPYGQFLPTIGKNKRQPSESTIPTGCLTAEATLQNASLIGC